MQSVQLVGSSFSKSSHQWLNTYLEAGIEWEVILPLFSTREASLGLHFPVLGIVLQVVDKLERVTWRVSKIIRGLGKIT